MNGHNSLSVQLGGSPWKSHFRLAFEFTHFPQGPPFGPVDQTRQGNRHTFRVDLKMKGIHCPLNRGCLFHVPPAQHVIITTRMTCLFLGSWIPNLLFPEHASYRKKWWETYLLKIWVQSNGHSDTIPGMFLKKMLNMVMWVWLNRTHLSGFCFQSISNTVDTVCLTHKRKQNMLGKNELRPTLTSLQYRSSTLKTIKCKQQMKCHISGCLKMSCFPGEPCQHKEPRRMSFHIHPRPNFATGVETSIVRNMTWLTKVGHRHFGCGLGGFGWKKKTWWPKPARWINSWMHVENLGKQLKNKMNNNSVWMCMGDDLPQEGNEKTSTILYIYIVGGKHSIHCIWTVSVPSPFEWCFMDGWLG